MKPDIFEILRTFSRYLEKNFRRIYKKNWEFPETYLGDFSRYLYLGLSMSYNPRKCKELTVRIERVCRGTV